MYKTFVDTWFAELWPFLEDGINDTRASFGVDAADSWPSVFAGHDVILSVVPATFDAAVTNLPDRLRHFGFLVPRPDPSPPPVTFPEGDAPAVLIGLSTTYQAQEPLLQWALDAVGAMDVRGLATTAGVVDAGLLRVPPNVVVADYVPHPAVLPHADVMVTHAGLGSVAAALSFGVPLVCTPISRDQPLNTERVEALGVGIGCTDRSPDEIAAAVVRVLGDPGYRVRASALGAESRSGGGAPAVVEDLARRARL
jgi:MGT family glycosyltransferase